MHCPVLSDRPDAMPASAVPAAVSAEEMSKPEYSKFSDLDGKTVGMLTGAPFEDLIKSRAPGVKEFQYFGAKADMQDVI